jgi:DNA-binding transcriptional LysR family regulator
VVSSASLMSRIDPVSLRVFVSVVEEGTIAAAAAREHMVPAAASKRISEIEEKLKTQLLTRNNRGVEPTPAGLALASLARRALSELDQIPVVLEGYASGVRGLVRLSASVSAMAQFLPLDIKSFLDTYPQVQLQVDERASAAVTKAVAENLADIGIFTASPHRSELRTSLYRRDRLVLAVPAGHRLADRERVNFEEALDEEFIAWSAGNAIQMLVNRFASSYGKSLRVRMNVGSFDALAAMVDCGLGIGVMPEAICLRSAATLGLRTVALEDEWATRDFYICVRRGDSQMPNAARLMAEHLSQCGQAIRS